MEGNAEAEMAKIGKAIDEHKAKTKQAFDKVKADITNTNKTIGQKEVMLGKEIAAVQNWTVREIAKIEGKLAGLESLIRDRLTKKEFNKAMKKTEQIINDVRKLTQR